MKNTIITNQQKIDVIESIFGKGNLTNDGANISVSCPVCKQNSKNSSNKKKLAISTDSGIYHCWVCETKGRNIGYLVKRYMSFRKEDLSDLYSLFNFKEKDEKEIEEVILKLPEDYKMLAYERNNYAKAAINYLLSRGLTREDFIRFKIGISDEFEYSNRVIFPSHSENMKLNFYLSRVFDDSTFRKYKNCDAKRKDIIFNEYLIDWDKPVILVEGIFDAIKAGNNSIPMLGSWIDESYCLFQKLVIHNTDIIMGFDPDAKDKEMKVAEMLSEYGNNVYILPNYNKDLGDMSKKEVNSLLEKKKLYEQSDRMTYLIQSIKSGSMF